MAVVVIRLFREPLSVFIVVTLALIVMRMERQLFVSVATLARCLLLLSVRTEGWLDSEKMTHEDTKVSRVPVSRGHVNIVHYYCGERLRRWAEVCVQNKVHQEARRLIPFPVN